MTSRHPSQLHVLGLVAGVLAGSCVPADPGGGDPDPGTLAGGRVRFAVLGDGGEGNDTQYLVGDAMHQVCETRGCDFVLYLGDNFYESGVASVDDEQFQTKFEMPYADFDVPFYVVLGNHDYGNGGLGLDASRAQYQVEYTEVSDRWEMPSEYYTFVREHVRFFALDTNAIFWGAGLGEQQDWLDAELEASTATWNVVFGHHPYISNGSHGNAGSYEGLPFVPVADGQSVKRFFDESVCERADVYFSGHDHNRQWLPATCGVQHFVSGAAAKTTALEGRGNATLFEDDTRAGFLWVEIDDDTLRGAFYDQDGTLDFEHAIARPSLAR